MKYNKNNKSNDMTNEELLSKGLHRCPFCNKIYSEPTGLNNHLNNHAKRNGWIQ